MGHGRGDFFAVRRDPFTAACGLGLNPALLLLVLARGSARDNAVTRWSAEAGASRLRMRWSTARAAIDALVRAKLVRRDKAATRPAYTLAPKGELLWLPNALVDGASDELPPLARLRQTQDVGAVRLLVEIYGSQNLREDGGVSPDLLWQAHQRTRLGQHGPLVVWRFHDPTGWVRWGNPAVDVHRKRLTKDECAEGLNPGVDLFRRLRILEALGLLTWVPTLFDGPAGEPMQLVHGLSELEDETTVFNEAAWAALRCLTPAQRDHVLAVGGVLVPVPAHVEQVQLIGVARLRYRPRTALTAAWWAEHGARCRDAADHYAAMAPDRSDP